MLNALLNGVVILFVVAVVGLSMFTGPVSSAGEVVVDHVTVDYPTEESRELAEGVAQWFASQKTANSVPMRFAIVNHDGRYGVQVPANRNAADSTGDAFRRFTARILTDLYNNGQPVDLVTVDADGKQQRRLSPCQPLGRLLREGRDYLFYEKSISEEEAGEFVKRFQRIGLFGGSGNTLQLSKTGERYRLRRAVTPAVLEVDKVALKGDALMLLTGLRRYVFDGQAVTLEFCTIEFETYPEMKWVAETHQLPHLSVRKNIRLAFDNSVELETTTAIVHRLISPFREGQLLQIELYAEDGVFHCWFPANFRLQQTPAQLENYCQSLGREVFSELPADATLIAHAGEPGVGETHQTKITTRTGEFWGEHENRIYYQAGVDPAVIAAIGGDLGQLGVFRDDTYGALRVEQDERGLIVKVVTPFDPSAEQPVPDAAMQSFEAVVNHLADKSLRTQTFRFVLCDAGLRPLNNTRSWQIGE